MVLISTAIPNPTDPPAKIIIKHSSYLNRFAVKDHIPASNAKINATTLSKIKTIHPVKDNTDTFHHYNLSPVHLRTFEE